MKRIIAVLLLAIPAGAADPWLPPDYLPGPIAVSADGRILIRHGLTIQAPGVGGRWRCSDIASAVRAALPEWNGRLDLEDDGRLGWDAGGNAITVVRAGGQTLTLVSSDGGLTWKVGTAQPVTITPPMPTQIEVTDPSAVRNLRDGDLEVEMMDPDAAGRFHRGQRFSPLAAVLQVRWRGVSQLLYPDRRDPQSDGAGLFQEFDPNDPPGYTEAKPGDPYLKIGVGVLAKSTPRYHFMQRDRILSSAVTKSVWRSDGVTFEQNCQNVGGYAYRLDADVRLDGTSGMVFIHHRLFNAGSRQLEVRQYAHNYFRPGGMSPAIGWRVRLPAPVVHVWSPRGEPEVRGLAQLMDDGVALTAAPNPRSIPLLFLRLLPLHGNSLPARVELQAGPSRIEASVDAPVVSQVAVYVDTNCMCPEQYVDLVVPPNGTLEWMRSWRFSSP